MADRCPAVLSFDDFVIQVDGIILEGLFSLFGLHPMKGDVFGVGFVPIEPDRLNPYLQYTCIIRMVSGKTLESSRTAHGDDSHELRSATAKAPTRANPSWLQKDRSAARDAVPQI